MTAGRFNGVKEDQKAWGTKLDAGYTFKNVVMAPRIFAGYAFMSGDDPNTTGQRGMGRLLWRLAAVRRSAGLEVCQCRWPPTVLSKVYDYNKLSTTGGEAVYSNLQIMTIGANANLMKDLTGRLSYSNLKL